MNPKLANTRVLEIVKHFGAKDNSVLAIEFFFYADRQDDASNLAIELHRLGYEIYAVNEPGAISKQWSITGITPKMSADDEAMYAWTVSMERLGINNNCTFDGWGTLIDQDID